MPATQNNPQFVCFGEILWDVLPSGAMPGGAPVNVCYHLNQLGGIAWPVSKIGMDKRGEGLISFLEDHHVHTGLIQTDTTHKTGVVMATQLLNNEMAYDIVKPVAWDYIDITDDNVIAVTAASHFIFGSLAARTLHSRDTMLGLIGHAKTKVLDVNLRPPHYDQETVAMLMQKADILKLNDHELQIIAGWHGAFNSPEEQIKLLSNTFSIPLIIVTKGGDGAMVYSDGGFYYNKGYKVIVSDTIGSGDAFLAGFLTKLTAGVAIMECLDFACRMGAFVASKKGACPDYTIEEVYYNYK